MQLLILDSTQFILSSVIKSIEQDSNCEVEFFRKFFQLQYLQYKFKQTMDYYQQKYNEQKLKNENMLKLQKTMFSDTEEFMKLFLRLQNFMNEIKGQASVDEEDEITPSEAEILVEQVISLLKKTNKVCECDRWKKLYQRESQQTLKLSHYTQQLTAKIKQKQRQQQIDRIQINQLLNDYLELYKKQFSVTVKQEKQTQKKRDKKQSSRSKSKGKMGANQSQTQRKNTKNMLGCQISPKDQNYIRMVNQKMQRDLNDLHKEIEQLRDQNMQKEQLIRIYRVKERKQLLYGCNFD